MEVYDLIQNHKVRLKVFLKDLIQTMSTQWFAHMKLLQGQAKVFPVLVLWVHLVLMKQRMKTMNLSLIVIRKIIKLSQMMETMLFNTLTCVQTPLTGLQILFQFMFPDFSYNLDLTCLLDGTYDLHLWSTLIFSSPHNWLRSLYSTQIPTRN